MDVRCTKCGIEYEFDDAKVTAAGVTVKCTSCGHVFKVKREEPAMVPASPSTSFQPQSTFAKGMSLNDGAEWMVKRVDGQVFRFKELTTLQKWIVERKVGRDDEISKTGKTWKKLGEIAELASFFQVVDAANAALQQAAMPAAPASIPPGFVVVPASSLHPSSIPPQSMPMGTSSPPQPAMSTSNPPMSVQPAMQPAMSTSNPPHPASSLPPMTQSAQAEASSPRMQAPADPVPPRPSAPVVPVRGGLGQERGRVPTGDVGLDALDDDDPVLQMIKRRRRNAALAVAFVVLVAGGLGAYAFREQLQEALGMTAPVVATSPHVDTAKAAVRDDKPESLQAARAALASPATPVEAAWVARVDVALAGHARAQAKLHEMLAAVVPAAKQEEHRAAAKKLRDESDAMLAGVYAALTRVRAEAPQLVDGHLAFAAYQLEKGGLAEQRADLETARAAAQKATDPAAAASVDAEIAVQQALAEATSGLNADPAAALAKLPASDDGRLRFAKALLSAAALGKNPSPTEADHASARAPAEGLGASDPRRALLIALLDAKKAPAATATTPTPPTAAADAGPEPGTAAVAVKPEDPAKNPPDDVKNGTAKVEPKDPKEPKEPKEPKATPVAAGGSPKKLVAAGWSALDKGKTAVAISSFKRALELDEALSEAQYGLAESYNAAGRKSEAKSAYQDYLKMDPKGKDAAAARGALENLSD